MSVAAVSKSMNRLRLYVYCKAYKNLVCRDQGRYFSQTPKLCSFFENDNRGAEYPSYPDKDWKEIFLASRKEFWGQCKLFYLEQKDRFQQDMKMYNHGDTEVFWRFDSQECLKNWRVSSDKTFNEGQSECSLVINDKKKAVFSGTVDLTVPKDGKNKFAGYCGIKSVKKKKSFYRDDCYEFEPFSHLELRVKGDGRNYAVNLGMGMYFDVNWFQTYTYILHTHGGPYWQLVRIPFSKFFLTSKGRIQDRQCPVPLDRVNCIGITCAGVAGPFRLEIDYIGCHCDFNYNEKFAYEIYKLPQEMVSS